MNKETKELIENLVNKNNCILFMKGTPAHPQCGFSSNTVTILKELLGDDFSSFNVLENIEVREGIKEYGNWPTIPQVYVNGELIGGNDIVTEMFNTGELHSMLNLPQPDRTPAKISISDTARKNILSGIEDIGNNVLMLSIDSQFNTRFSIDQPKGYEVISDIDGIKIYMDVGTSKKANGIEIDWVEDLQGAGLVIKNPNEPKAVIQLSVELLKQGIETGEYVHIYDVRSEEQYNSQHIPNSKRLDKDNMQVIESLDKNTPLVFVCTVGNTSQGACEFYRKKGFNNINNLVGGVTAWYNKKG
jgi:monothiol glutaredoxin